MSAATPIKATFSDFKPWSRYKRGRSLIETIEAYSMPVPFCGCWIWTGAAARYGSMKFGKRAGKAHRFSWEAYKGEIPAGLEVCHTCDVTLCVNPDHLFLGTHLENMHDRDRKGRGNQPSGKRNGHYTKPEKTLRGDAHYTRLTPGLKRGEGNGRAKLTDEDIATIREMGGSNAATARTFGVTKTTIRKIRIRESWSHI
jgi:hypothetical protein